MTRLIRAGLLLLAVLTAGPTLARVKLVELGWDIPSTAFLRAHWQRMEREAPFDGVVFSAEAKDDQGRPISSEAAWGPERWQRAWFDAALADLKSCRFTRFTDNFVRLNASPKAVSWDDDAGWTAMAEKAAILAWLARGGGAKGIAFDVEPYGSNQWQWDSAAKTSFAETSATARRRGAQLGRAIAAEMPNAVVMTLFANSVLSHVGRSADPQALLAKEGYGLLPAFFDGLLSAAPPEMALVDGCENGYYLDSAEAYQRAALEMKGWQGPSLALVSPANRARYRQQVQAGFGFYLDMFINPEGHTYYRGPLDGSRLRRLTRNLTAARDAADEYVWVYGEQCRWWSDLAPWREADLAKTAGRGKHWEEALPGITRAIDRIRDLEGSALAELATSKPPNLLANPDLAQGPAADQTLPTGWSAWQYEKEPTGTFAWDKTVGDGSARATKVTWGCFLQGVEAQPGAVYLVEARCRRQGSGSPALTVRWQTAEHRWTREPDDRTFAFGAAVDGWQFARGVVTAPDGIGRLVVLLDIRGQRDDQSQVWFDAVRLHRLAD
ncbi:MAG: hypothetical protein HZB16_22180 [Armatimonadetes bacterium]|nr:hypothetical protein [Armatimonadota bacterium]